GWDIILANILSSVIRPLLPAFGEAVPSGGSLLVSGILEEEAEDVLADAAAAGFRARVEDLEDEWWSAWLLREQGAERRARPSSSSADLRVARSTFHFGETFLRSRFAGGAVACQRVIDRGAIRRIVERADHRVEPAQRSAHLLPQVPVVFGLSPEPQERCGQQLERVRLVRERPLAGIDHGPAPARALERLPVGRARFVHGERQRLDRVGPLEERDAAVDTE